MYKLLPENTRRSTIKCGFRHQAGILQLPDGLRSFSSRLKKAIVFFALSIAFHYF
jgi:hypothetical protein